MLRIHSSIKFTLIQCIYLAIFMQNDRSYVECLNKLYYNIVLHGYTAHTNRLTKKLDHHHNIIVVKFVQTINS